MACSGAAGREDYGERYRYTLKAEEVAFFKSLAEDFAIKPPLAGGSLFTILFQILGRSFPYPHFKVCLCEPTNAVSSTMAEMIVIPSQDSVNASLQSIVHEAGVHFIGLELSAIFRNDMEGLIRMVEAAICYLKPEIFRGIRVEVGEDHFLVGMRLEREAAVFGSIWRKSKTPEVIDAIAEAYVMMRQS